MSRVIHSLWPWQGDGGINTNGLLFNIDPGGYSGSGTLVPDATGNGRDGTIVNGPVFSSSNGGYFTYDGTNDYMEVPLTGTYSSFTMSIWVYRLNSWSAYSGIVYHRLGSTATHGLNASPTLNRLGYTWNNQSSTWSWDPGASMNIPVNQWSMLTMRVEPTTTSIFLNKVKATNAVSSTAGQFGGSGTKIRIAHDSNTSAYLNLRAGPIFAYDRALSDSEIERNYDAMAGRFA